MVKQRLMTGVMRATIWFSVAWVSGLMRMKVSAMVSPISWAKAAATLISGMPYAAAMRGTRTVSAWLRSRSVWRGSLIERRSRACRIGPAWGSRQLVTKWRTSCFGELLARDLGEPGHHLDRVDGQAERGVVQLFLAAEVVVDQGRVHARRLGDQRRVVAVYPRSANWVRAAAMMASLVRVVPGAARAVATTHLRSARSVGSSWQGDCRSLKAVPEFAE